MHQPHFLSCFLIFFLLYKCWYSPMLSLQEMQTKYVIKLLISKTYFIFLHCYKKQQMELKPAGSMPHHPRPWACERFSLSHLRYVSKNRGYKQTTTYVIKAEAATHICVWKLRRKVSNVPTSEVKQEKSAGQKIQDKLVHALELGKLKIFCSCGSLHVLRDLKSQLPLQVQKSKSLHFHQGFKLRLKILQCQMWKRNQT